MRKSQVLFWAFLSLLLFLGNGCAGFRELFSDPGAEKRRSEKRQQTRKESKKSLQSSRYNRDPLDDIFMRDPKRREDWSKNSNLTEAEKRAVRNAMDPDDDFTRKQIDKIYLENERKRTKRQNDVFGLEFLRDSK